MPTVLRIGSLRFFFYAGDRAEPPHVHVEQGECVAKFWLKPVRLNRSSGFSTSELTRLEKLVVSHSEQFLESWEEFFGGT